MLADRAGTATILSPVNRRPVEALPDELHVQLRAWLLPGMAHCGYGTTSENQHTKKIKQEWATCWKTLDVSADDTPCLLLFLVSALLLADEACGKALIPEDSRNQPLSLLPKSMACVHHTAHPDRMDVWLVTDLWFKPARKFPLNQEVS
jgi:hypothetical protein